MTMCRREDIWCPGCYSTEGLVGPSVALHPHLVAVTFTTTAFECNVQTAEESQIVAELLGLVAPCSSWYHPPQGCPNLLVQVADMWN